MKVDKIILGIDPGTTIMGYGVIKVCNNKMELLAMGVIDLRKYTTQPLKLKNIFERTLSIIEQYLPDEVALEAPFYGKNVQSMLKLGRSQGVAIAAALHKDVPVWEYAPKKVKQSVTGNGNASKEQVASMLKSLIKFNEESRFLDATDGLAVAVCHSFQKSTTNEGKSYSGWKSFVKNNPGKVH